MSINKLIIAAAGSGKTTFLIDDALKQSDKKVLITTYTIANEFEIRRKIIEKNKFVPDNITIQTWFSFLLQHGVRPYQGCLYDRPITGMLLMNTLSGVKYKTKQGIPVCYKEDTELEQHYFSESGKIYSDKLTKFIIRVNDKSNGCIIDRLSRIYSTIYVDEVQDLAGYDLEFLKLLFKSSANVLLVGDPRQVTYLTHHEKKYSKYSYGKIKDFVKKECKRIKCEIDEISLNTSHRNNRDICNFSSKLYPQYSACSSGQSTKTTHDGVFFVKTKDIPNYLEEFRPIQLRLNRDTKGIHPEYEVYNFGESKGRTFDRVLIYPTAEMIRWIFDPSINLADKTRAQFYVALTRAKFSSAIVYNYSGLENVENVQHFSFPT